MKTITLISGKAQNGKDFTANVLKNIYESNNETAVIMHYGDLLKNYARDYYGWDGKKDEAGRSLLQNLGTAIRRKDPDYWVNALLSAMQVVEFDHILVADCRYPNEIDAVKAFYNDSAVEVRSIRVIRPEYDNGLTKEQKEHSSETALDDYLFDEYLFNDGTSRYVEVIKNPDYTTSAVKGIDVQNARDYAEYQTYKVENSPNYTPTVTFQYADMAIENPWLVPVKPVALNTCESMELYGRERFITFCNDVRDAIKDKQYYVTYRIEGRFVCKVNARTEEDARKLSVEKFCDADFGELSDINGYPVIVEDEEGNFVWEK